MLLITGGNGFLGKHVQKHIKVDFIAPTSIKMDLLKQDSFIKYVRSVKPRKILHLAARCGGIKYNMENPAKLIYENTKMAISVFEAARHNDVEEVITIGSTCQYPADLKPPFKVEDMWRGYPEPTNGAYGISKRLICEMGQAYMSQYGVNHKHVIFANLYGPGDNCSKENGHVVSSLIQKVIDDESIAVWGDGSAKREFLFVDDAAKILASLVKDKFDGPVNVGSNSIITISELVKVIQKVTRSEKPVVFNLAMPSGQKERLLDSKHKGDTDIEAGIQKIWHLMN